MKLGTSDSDIIAVVLAKGFLFTVLCLGLTDMILYSIS